MAFRRLIVAVTFTLVVTAVTGAKPLLDQRNPHLEEERKPQEPDEPADWFNGDNMATSDLSRHVQDMEQLASLGKDMGLEGKELLQFINQQQAIEREERAAQRAKESEERDERKAQEDRKFQLERLQIELQMGEQRVSTPPVTVGTDAKSVGAIFFQAKTIDGFTGSTSQVTTIIFDDVRVNVGGGYDPDTSHFTAPVAGWYYFIYHLHPKSGTTNYIVTHLVVENVNVEGTGAEWPNGMSSTSIVYLEVGHSVWVQCNADDDPRIHTTDEYNSFIGYLMYQSI